MEISELFTEEPLIDESTLPDAGAPEAEQQLDPAPAAPEATPEPQPPKEPAHVPLGALQEERQRRQELKAELEQERQHRQKMEERFQQMMERFNQPPAVQEEPIPAFEEDPAAHIEGLKRKYERDLGELRQFKTQQEQQTQQQQQVYQVMQAASAAEAAFTAQAPDYNEVAKAFTDREVARYRAFGVSEQQAREQVSRDYLNLTIHALQSGQNPAELLYNAAKQLGGISAAPSAQNEPQQAPRAPNGQFVAKQAPATLATVSGSPKAPDEQGELTLDQVAKLSDAEFDAYWSRMSRQSKVKPTF